MQVTSPAIFLVLLVLLSIFIIRIANNSGKYRTYRFPKSYTLSQVDAMDGHEFEYFCADLLKYDGFNHISVTPASNDQGVDIVAYKDSVKYAIQCKRYNSKISNKAVQEVNTGKSVYRCAQAIVLTNNYFTKSAYEAARATGVLLWDRNKLSKLIHVKEIARSNSSENINHSGKANTPGKASSILFPVFVILVFFFGLYRFSTTVTESGYSLPDISPPAISVKPTQRHTVTPTPAPVISSLVTYEFNSTVASDTFAITVKNSMFARHNGNLKYMAMAPDGLINCAVYVDIANLTDQVQSLDAIDAVLICDGVQYPQLVCDDSEFLFSRSELSPHESLVNSVIDFQISTEYETSDEELIFVFVLNNSYAAWKIR